MFARCGKATWIGVLIELLWQASCPFVTKPSRELGDVTADIWQSVFDDKIADGSGPVFMNCSQTSEEDLQHMRESFVSEGDTSLNDYMDQFGIDLHKDMVEFGTYEYMLTGRGLDIDMQSATTLPGLYASGDLTGNVRGDITSAAVFGQIAGENAADYSKDKELVDVSDMPIIQEKINWYDAIISRKSGAHWMEVNSTLNQIMDKYVGVKTIRSETLLLSAQKYLSDLKRYAAEQLKAENSHELVRSLEVMDLIDVGLATAYCSENRKESRGMARRIDYPFTNPLMGNKFQTIHLDENGKPVMEFRDKVKKAE